MWTFWLVAVAGAETYQVAIGGAYSLQQAAASATRGDTIEVAQGTFLAAGLPLASGVTLRGAGIGLTTLAFRGDQGLGGVVTLDGVTDVVIEDLTLSGSLTGRVLFMDESAVAMTSVSFVDGPTGNGLGALIYLDHSNLTLKGVTFDGLGSRALGGGLVFSQSSVLSMEGGQLLRGTASGHGGGLYAKGSQVTLSGVTLEGNRANGGGGGAIRFEGGPRDQLIVEGSAFIDNGNASIAPTSDTSGAGLHAVGGLVSVHASAFESNASVFGGGGIALSFVAQGEVADSTFLGNTALSDGGAIAVYQGQQVRLLRNDIRASASGNIGGSIHIAGDGAFDIEGNRICSSAAQFGGGISVNAGAEPLAGGIRNNVIASTHADVMGGALLVWGDAALTIANNTLIDGTAVQGSVRVGVNPTVTFLNNALVRHGVALWDDSGRLSASYNLYSDNVQDLAAQALDGNPLLADPGFVDDGPGCEGDLRPATGSALVDAGDPTLSDDDGTRSDVGAYGGPGASAVMDIDGDGVLEGDCDPFDPEQGGPEPEVVGDGVDQDCDGLDLCYLDEDGDGVGIATTVAGQCDGPGLAAIAGDCDDADPSRAADCSDGAVPPDEATPSAWYCGSVGTGRTSLGLLPLLFLLAVRWRRS